MSTQLSSALALILKVLSWATMIGSLIGFIISLFSPMISKLLGTIVGLTGLFVFVVLLSLSVILEKISDLEKGRNTSQRPVQPEPAGK